MNKLKYIFLSCLLTLGLVSCEDFLDVNVDPNAPAKVGAEQIMPVVMFYAAQTNYDNAEYGVYLSQCLTTGGRAQNGALAYQSGWAFLGMNRHPMWRRHFFDIGKNTYEMSKAAEEAGMADYLAVGRVIMLMSTLITTDTFGDMPRTEAYQAASPRYDSQESIYAWMTQEADDLLAYFDSPEVHNVSKPLRETQDRVFKGDVNKWKQVVYALKARLLLRNIPAMNNTPAMCDAIISAAELALAGWTEPLYHYPSGSIQEHNCPWSEVRPIVNTWESRGNALVSSMPSKFFMEQMLKYDAQCDTAQHQEYFKLDSFPDPRLPYLMEKRISKTTKKYAYRYLENNFGKDASMDDIEFPDLYACTLTKTTSAVSLFPTEELHFIIAEAAYWKNDKVKAVSAMRDGITTHMKKLGVPEEEINRYLSSDLVPGVANITLADIMREKYIAMYLQFEQWTDMRRYNYSNNGQNKFGLPGEEVIIYPTLRRPYNLYVAYWSVDEPNEWIQRINYDPETEYKYNRNELIRLGAYDESTDSGNPEWLKKPMIWSPIYNK